MIMTHWLSGVITGRNKAGDRGGGGCLGESMKIKNVSDPQSTSFKLPQFSFLDATSVKKITIKIHLTRPSYWVNFRWYSVCFSVYLVCPLGS